MTDTQAPRSAPLAELTTLRLGGPAREIVRCADTRAIVDAISELDARSEPVLVIGGGSNLVIGDAGSTGPPSSASDRIEFGTGRESGRAHVVADAGVNWDTLVAATVDAGYGGLQRLSGIPGASGATPVQNVGAYGVEVADILRSVQVLYRPSGTLRWVAPAELGLGYRTSNLKNRDDFVVVAVPLLNDDRRSQPIRYRELASTVGVEPGERVDVVTAREAVLGLRRNKGMVLDRDDFDTWSAGSFFTNPIVPGHDAPAILDRIAARVGEDVSIPTYPAGPQPGEPAGAHAIKLSAGWLIERAGFSRGHPGPD